MRRALAIWTTLVTLMLPAAAWANPNTESPEPTFWMFVLLGAIPLFVLAYWRMFRKTESPVTVEQERSDALLR